MTGKLEGPSRWLGYRPQTSQYFVQRSLLSHSFRRSPRSPSFVHEGNETVTCRQIFSPFMKMIVSLHQEYENGNPNRSHQPRLHQLLAMLSTAKCKGGEPEAKTPPLDVLGASRSK